MARKDGSRPKHICGVLARYKDVSPPSCPKSYHQGRKYKLTRHKNVLLGHVVTNHGTWPTMRHFKNGYGP